MSLDDMIESLRALGDADSVAKSIAARAAPLLEQAVKRTAAAGTTVDGTAWVPKKDGQRALAHAADHVSAQALGPFVRLTLRGPEVFHHLGAGHNPRRAILPEGGAKTPAAVTAALEQAARAELAARSGGR